MRCLKPELLLAIVLLVGTGNAAVAGQYTNFLGMQLVDIPAGSFEMGSCKISRGIEKENRKREFLGLSTVKPACGKLDENVNDNEVPRHTVRISAFRLAATPVTAGQYKTYLKAIGEMDNKDNWGLYNEEFRRLNSFGDNAPVVQVSWHEAQDFIRWLNENKPADDPHNYRMPSEAEWEYACRAGGNHRYCGSNDISDVGWVNRSGTEYQREVTSKAPNAWGLYGMSGSVWQWVEDIYHDSYVGAPADGSAWNTLRLDDDERFEREIEAIQQAVREGKIQKIDGALTIERIRFDAGLKDNNNTLPKSNTIAARVLRGGSWRFSEDFARATYRLAGEPGNWYYGNGFRVAASLP